MTKEEVAYQEWLKDVSGKLPEDERVAFERITGSEAGKELFRGVSRREDYNRRVNEVEGTRRQLKSWWDEEKPKNEALVAERAALQERTTQYERQLREYGLIEDSPAGGRPSTPASVVKKDDLAEIEKRLEARVTKIDQAFPQVLAEFTDIAYRAAKDGYNVSPKDVIAHAMENGLSASAAYDALTYTERQKRDADVKVKEQEKWKEEGRREALSKFSIPPQSRPAGPTIVDTLRDKDFRTDTRSRVDAAVKDFMEGGTSGGMGLV